MSGLIQGVTRVPADAGAGQEMSANIASRQSPRWANQGPTPAQVAALYADAPTADPFEQIRDAAVLHQRGLLTDEEFTAEKAMILGS